jgi:hypothetical protein
VAYDPRRRATSMWDASPPAGRLYYWNSHYLPAPSDAAIDLIASHAWDFSSPFFFTLLSHMGGAIRGARHGLHRARC